MIKVIDDVVPLEEQDRILDMVQDYRFDWHFGPSNVYENDVNKGTCFIDNATVDSLQFTHLFLHTQIKYMDPSYEAIRPLVHSIQKQFNLDSTNVYRVKANMLTNNKDFFQLAYNPAHVDGEYEHYVVVYYVNDCDGDTIVFNETHGSKFEQLTIKERISPKKGRAVMFPGKYFHASSNPLNSSWRSVININLSTAGKLIL